MVLTEMVSEGTTCGQNPYPVMLSGVAPSAKDLGGASLASGLLGMRTLNGRRPSRTRKQRLIRSGGEAQRRRDGLGSVKWGTRMWHRQNRRIWLYKLGDAIDNTP